MTEKQPTEPPEELHPEQATPDVESPAGEGGAPDDLQQQRDDLMARLQRVSADYLNYQKRVQRDVEQARQFSNEALMRELLPVLDNMERALEAARANRDPEDALLTGMQLVHDSMLEKLGQFGLSRIESAGETFNPELHAALMQQPTDEHPPMTVLQEVQKGYQLKGRTLRPAQVVVSKEPDEDEASE